MKKIYIFLLLCLQLLGLSLPSLGEAAIAIPAKPTTSIYVQDYAHVLSPQIINNINAYSLEVDKKTTAQIVVVTIPTLDGASLEEFSTELYRQWGIGTKEKNNGVLLLVVVNDRKSRIEVGYGLEGALPDGLTGRIQDSSMLPYFKTGDYNKGIWQGYGNIVTTVLKEYNLTPDDLKISGTRPTPTNNNSSAFGDLPWWVKALLFIGFIILMILDQMFLGGTLFRTLLLLFMRGGGRGGGGGGFGGGGGGGFGGGRSGGGGSSRGW